MEYCVGICEMARMIDDIEGVWESVGTEDATAHELFSEWELKSEILFNFLCDFARKAIAKARKLAKERMTKYLNRMDRSREIRYAKDKAERKGMERQCNGFRSEWYRYLDEIGTDNLYS